MAERLPACAQVIETLAVGGAENLAVRMANDLAARGHPSHLVAIERTGPLAARLDPGVTLHELDFRRGSVRNPPAFALSLRRGYRLLSGLLRAHGIGVVQTHLPGANFWGLLLAFGGHAGIVATIHNNQEFRYGEADRRWRAALRKRAYRSIVRRCARVIAVSEAVKRSFADELGLDRSGRTRIEAVPNGVPIPAPLPPERRERLRAHYGVAVDDVLILAAGRHCEQKNFGDLVAAIALMDDDLPRHRLVLAGDGELTPVLRSAVASAGLGERVAMPGNVGGIDALMSAADIFVLPSLWEGLPLVLLEAMAAGLPVVANRIPGVAEIVGDEREGVLVEPGRPQDLAGALTRLVRDPASRLRLGGAGRELVRCDYDLARVVARISAIYRDVSTAGERPGD